MKILTFAPKITQQQKQIQQNAYSLSSHHALLHLPSPCPSLAGAVFGARRCRGQSWSTGHPWWLGVVGCVQTSSVQAPTPAWPGGGCQ